MRSPTINRFSIAAILFFLIIVTLFLQKYPNTGLFGEPISNILLIILVIYTGINMLAVDLGGKEVKIVAWHILYIGLIVVIGLPFVMFSEVAYLGITKMFGSLFLLLSIVYWNRDKRVLKAIWNGLIILGFIAVFGAILDGLFEYSYIMPEPNQGVSRLPGLGINVQIPRATGFISSNGLFGSIISTATMLMLGGYFVRVNSAFISRILALLALPLSLVGIILAQGRSNLLALGVGLALFIFLLQRKQKGVGKRILQLLLVFGAVLLIIVGAEFYRTLYSVSEYGVTSRFEVFGYAFELFKQAPILGSGHAATREYFNLSHVVHNGFLRLVNSYGLLGLLGFFSLFWYSFRNGVRHIDKKSELGFLTITLLSASVAVIVEINLYPAFTDPIIYILCGLMLTINNFHS